MATMCAGLMQECTFERFVGITPAFSCFYFWFNPTCDGQESCDDDHQHSHDKHEPVLSHEQEEDGLAVKAAMAHVVGDLVQEQAASPHAAPIPRCDRLFDCSALPLL